MLWEYLLSLTGRKKWKINFPNLEIGYLVILVSKSPVHSAWWTGHVAEIYPGVDGVVWSMKVKIPNNKFVRPTASLCKSFHIASLFSVMWTKLKEYICSWLCWKFTDIERFMTLKFRLEFPKIHFSSSKYRRILV